MSFPRDLRSELVEKRLWPVALLLLAALVAVPLVLAKSPPPGSSDQTDTALAPPSGAAAHPAGGVPAVSVVATANDDAPLRGHAKDPFRQQYLSKPASTALAPTSPAPSATTPAATPPSGSGGGSPGGGAAPTPVPKTYLSASIEVRFGRATSRLRTIKDVPRLTPLPSAADPVVIFLGMRSDEKTAVFMVSTDVHAQGDGRCTPSKKDCEAVELKADQVALLDVAAADGTVTQYELDLVKVTLHRTTSKPQAESAYARVSKAGLRLLRRRAATSAVATGLRYSPRAGVLLAVPGTFLSSRLAEPSADGARAPQAVAGMRHEGWVTPAP